MSYDKIVTSEWRYRKLSMTADDGIVIVIGSAYEDEILWRSRYSIGNVLEDLRSRSGYLALEY